MSRPSRTQLAEYLYWFIVGRGSIVASRVLRHHQSDSQTLIEVVTMKLLTPPEAAHLLAVQLGTLTKWRWAGSGPVFHRIGGPKRGAIRYSSADLDAFVAASRVEV